MVELLTFENLGNLIMLCFLQAVLGFDKLLYISIRASVRPWRSKPLCANGVSCWPWPCG